MAKKNPQDGTLRNVRMVDLEQLTLPGYVLVDLLRRVKKLEAALSGTAWMQREKKQGKKK